MENQNQTQEKPLTFLELSNKFIYIASLAGAGFSLYQMYNFFYPNKKVEFEEETNEIEEEPKKTSIDMD